MLKGKELRTRLFRSRTIMSVAYVEFRLRPYWSNRRSPIFIYEESKLCWSAL